MNEEKLKQFLKDILEDLYPRSLEYCQMRKEQVNEIFKEQPTGDKK